MTIIENFTGKDLEGKRYQPLFPYFADQRSKRGFPSHFRRGCLYRRRNRNCAFCPCIWRSSTFMLARREEIELVCPVDNNGRFTAEIPEYVGLFVKDADKDIIKHLKTRGHVFHHATLHHRYPFCWRSDTPLIYKAVHDLVCGS